MQLAQVPPTTVFGSADEHAVLMGAYANQIGTIACGVGGLAAVSRHVHDYGR